MLITGSKSIAMKEAFAPIYNFMRAQAHLPGTMSDQVLAKVRKDRKAGRMPSPDLSA
jgi:hypothetical protein